MMDSEKAVELLKAQLTAIPDLKGESPDSPDFKEWREKTRLVITRLPHQYSCEVKRFECIPYLTRSFSAGKDECDRVYVQGLESAEAQLNALIYGIEAVGTETDAQPSDAMYQLDLLFNRFHAIARQLRDRREGRATLSVDDEYDVQDLLHALLKLFFDDIRPEEWTPSYAGAAGRMDFLLKKERIVIEVKRARPNHAAKGIGDELLIDIQRYQAHTDCNRLVCFVYDPEGVIGNPTGLENDLRQEDDAFSVSVHVRPSA